MRVCVCSSFYTKSQLMLPKMSENPAEVRLVRCPKCENLLPEVTDYPVYLCNGCGAVLRARNKHKLTEKPDEETDEGILNQLSKGFGDFDFLKNKSVRSGGKVNSNGSSSDHNVKIAQDFEYPEPGLRNHSRSVRRNGGKNLRNRSQFDVNESSSDRDFRSSDGFVDDERSELLRKLDELKDQIVRSRPLGGERSTEKAPMRVVNDPFRPRSLERASFPTSFDRNPYEQPWFSGNGVADEGRFHRPSSSYQAAAAPTAVFGHHDYNRGLSDPHATWSNDLRRRRRPMGILTAGERRCRPVDGGSPFVACCKCFELLEIPKWTTTTTKKTRSKMRCGGCSEVVSLSVVGTRLVLSLWKAPDRNSDDLEDHRRPPSEDYDHSGGYDSPSIDRFPSGGEVLTDARSVRSMSSNIAEAPKPSPPPTGSPLQDHFDYSTKYNRAGKGDGSGKSNVAVEEVKPPVEADLPAAAATEIDIPLNEYRIHSQESGDASREAEPPRTTTGGGESFFAGIVKKSFRELSEPSQHVEEERVNVTVNGHAIQDRLVKKAEKLAGPIQPGEYWYDSRAGFWGVIGGPCRGIIPPFIEEFNYPMPERCADGNTNVFVNGRELHRRDLDLLTSRGLPPDSDRSYIIEISGRVLDEDTGQELRCLGKLAPTVESKKRGFGMRPPRAAAV